MTDRRKERVLKMAASASSMLQRAQREAEALADQNLSDDLLMVSVALVRVLEAGQRRRYVSPRRR